MLKSIPSFKKSSFRPSPPSSHPLSSPHGHIFQKGLPLLLLFSRHRHNLLNGLWFQSMISMSMKAVVLIEMDSEPALGIVALEKHWSQSPRLAALLLSGTSFPPPFKLLLCANGQCCGSLGFFLELPSSLSLSIPQFHLPSFC